jgi:hypothetical protein
MLQPECIRVFHAYGIIEPTADTPAGKNAICQIIMD